eukprot:TRINITY_DN10284_c0_g1_i7.p1 TRINITY_DN10284_c0_g1~~TRINITY_DN10284_c0_g1_i7.p1  ORF type:complete len:614 (+),score=166.58 TRINITY_DN10284_c0_g1_i7:83-1924(+)
MASSENLHIRLRSVRSGEDKAEIQDLLAKTSGVLKILNELYTKRCKAQQNYSQQLTKLGDETTNKLNKLLSGSAIAASPLGELAYQACQTCQEEALELEGTARATAATVKTTTANLKLKQDIVDALFKARDNIDAELANEETTVAKLKKGNDGAQHALKVAKGNAGAAFDKRAAKKLEKSGLKEEQAVVFKKQAHNDYVLGLTACNMTRSTRASNHLVEALDALQDMHTRLLTDCTQLINKATQQALEAQTKAAKSLNTLSTTASQLTSGAELSHWLAGFQPHPCLPPEELEYQPPPDAEGIEANDDWKSQQLHVDGMEAINEEKQDALLSQVRELASKIGEEQNTLMAMEKMFLEYQTHPSFGSADTVLLKLYESRQEVHRLQSQMEAVHVQLALLQGIPAGKVVRDGQLRRTVKRQRGNASSGRKGRILPSTSSAGDKRLSSLEDLDWEDDEDDFDDDDWDVGEFDDDVPRAVALYDFFGSNEEHLTFYSGNVVELAATPEGEEWWTGKLEGRTGSFPSDYVKRFACNSRHLALALYDHQAEDGDEQRDDLLYFASDDVLVVTEPHASNGCIAEHRHRQSKQGNLVLSKACKCYMCMCFERSFFMRLDFFV